MVSCSRCGRELSNSTSIKRKMGRKCYEKAGASKYLNYSFYINYPHEDKIEQIVKLIKNGVHVRRILEKEKISYNTYKKALKIYNFKYRPAPASINEFKRKLFNITNQKNENEISNEQYDEKFENLLSEFKLNDSDRYNTFFESIKQKNYKRAKIPNLIKKNKVRNKRQLDSYYRIIILKEKQKMLKT